MYIGAAIVVSAAAGAASAESQRKAASKAAGAAQGVADAQTASQERMFDIQRQDFSPFQQGGAGAMPTLLSLSGYNMGASTPEMEQQYLLQELANDPEYQRLSDKLQRVRGGANYGIPQGEEIKKIERLLQGMERSTKQTLSDSPYYMLNGQYYTRAPIAKMEESPGYKWQLEQGERNTNRALAARGKYDSGQAYGILNDSVYRPLAAQETDKFYNRQLGLVGIGQGAAGQVAGAAQNYGNNMTNIYGALGQAQSNAALAKGQAQSGLYSSLGSLPMNAVGTYALGKYSGLWGGSPTAAPTK